ncbi:hypothetical protein LUZ60_008087 [Juncus effusus]|nr:hypothetical protein LUZ60_008087 [Juncus effusus]
MEMNTMRDASYNTEYLGLYGDVLEAVVTQVPSIDLIQASRVSHEWRRAIRSSLHRNPRRLPWLILRHLPRRNSSSFSVHAFDPNSRTWLSLPKHQASDKRSEGATKSFLCGSNGDRLYGLSISKMVISDDPFGVTWRMETKGPKVWRQDPVIADLGKWVIVAGGGCPMALVDEDEVGAVEIYDKQSKVWQSAESMPVQFDGSTSAMWLSTSVSQKSLYVIEKKSGYISRFDPERKKWACTRQLIPDRTISSWCITIGRNNRLVLVGVGKEGERNKKVKLWEVEEDDLCVINNKFEEMPREMVERLFPCEEEDDETWHSCSVKVCGTEQGGYVYNPSEIRHGAVFYEISKDEGGRIVKRWEWVPLSERFGDNMVGSIAFGCSPVGFGELAGLRLN